MHVRDLLLVLCNQTPTQALCRRQVLVQVYLPQFVQVSLVQGSGLRGWAPLWALQWARHRVPRGNLALARAVGLVTKAFSEQLWDRFLEAVLARKAHPP